MEVATESAGDVFGLKPDVGSSIFRSRRWPTCSVRRSGRAGRPLPGARGEIQNSSGGRSGISARSRADPRPRAPADGAILVLSDVTQLRQQDEIKRGVIPTVSHQLKTPLTSIRMAIHLLLEEKVGPLTEKQAELLVTAREDSDRLHGILNNLLDISRIESGKARWNSGRLPPRIVVQDAMEPFRRAAQDQGVELCPPKRREIFPTSGPMRPGSVTSSGTLLSNALKYTRRGGASPVRSRRGG